MNWTACLIASYAMQIDYANLFLSLYLIRPILPEKIYIISLKFSLLLYSAIHPEEWTWGLI